MDMVQNLKELLATEEFAAQVQNVASVEDMQNVLADNGIEMDTEMVSGMMQAIVADAYDANELQDDDLEEIFGGGSALKFFKDLWEAIKFGWKLGKNFYKYEQELYAKLEKRDKRVGGGR